MSLRPVRACARSSALVLLFLLPRPAAAAWPVDPAVNVPLCVAANYQFYPEAAPDGSGGAIVAWDDLRGGVRDIYAQRVDRAGTPRWTSNGVNLCAATGEQYEPQLIPDGSGGAFIVWTDGRGAAYDIYAQRVDSSGAPKWTANGVALCTATGYQSHPAIISDGSGGAIVTWDDERSGGIGKIYAQRLNASGAAQWTANGKVLTNAVSGQARPVIVPGVAGGAIVAWEDIRNGELDIFAQRIQSNGTVDPAWPAGGLAVALLGGNPESITMAIDGNGGAFVSWAKFNGGTRDNRVQHVLVSGAIDPAWPAGGRVLIVDFYDHGWPAILADGAGGALVSWVTSRDIYAHHVLASGALDPSWPALGVAVSLGPGEQIYPQLVSDGAGGAIITWQDLRADEGDMYAQHLLATGAVDSAWPADGRALSTAGQLQISPSIVSDGAGGAVVAWQDKRSATPQSYDVDDIYAQGVRANGQLGDGPVSVPGEAGSNFALQTPSPNPTRMGAMIMRFTLPSAAAASLDVFDVAGRHVTAREVGSLGAGHHAVDLAAGWRPAAGIYFVRLRQGQDARTRRIVVVDE